MGGIYKDMSENACSQVGLLNAAGGHPTTTSARGALLIETDFDLSSESAVAFFDRTLERGSMEFLLVW